MCGEDIFHCCIFRLILWETDHLRPVDVKVAKANPSQDRGLSVSSREMEAQRTATS